MSALRLSARRTTGRALSGIRTAPYMRKWLVLGIAIGIVAGLGAVVFYEGLHLATQLLLTDIGGYTPARTAGEGGFRVASGFSRPWAIPLVVGGGGLLAGVLVFRWAPEAEGHGTDAAIKAVHSNPKGVRPRVILVKLVASAVTIGSGGSGGREGPTAQISSGFGSVMARVLNLTPADSRICVASGIASGIGAIFRAPFGGALLGVELLYTDDVEIEALIPSLVATVVGYAIFCAITGSYAPIFGSHNGLATISLTGLALFVVIGLACGIVGKLYTNCFYAMVDHFNAWRVPRAVKPGIAGVLVGLIGLAVPGVLGTGYGELQTELSLHHLLTTPWLIVLLIPFAKLVATSLSIGSGGSGGIFGPGMVIGGATGALLWRVAHLAGLAPHDQVAFIIVGMAACFASIAHAPVAVLVMVVEMTGSLGMLPAATVAVAFAMLVVGETTIYRSQLRRRSDSPAHRFDFRLAATKLTAAELMSPPRLVVQGATPTVEALQMLRDAEVAGAPVINEDGAFLGSVESDAVRAAVDKGHGGTPIARLADPEAVTLPAEAGLDAAVEALPESDGGWVPVLDDDMRVRGIISAPELLRGARETMRTSWSEMLAATTSTSVLEGAIGKDSPASGRTVAELRLPPGAIVLSASRSGALRFPDAGDRLNAGDRVTVLVAPAQAAAVRATLGLPEEADGGDGPATSRPTDVDAASPPATPSPR